MGVTFLQVGSTIRVQNISFIHTLVLQIIASTERGIHTPLPKNEQSQWHPTAPAQSTACIGLKCEWITS
jgi:hypothetical protein